MRKKTIICSIVTFSLLFLFVVPIVAQTESGSFMSNWGKTLKQYADNQGEAKSEIYARGKSTTITKKDVQQATDFYLLSGLNRKEAEKQAIDSVKEREALYAVAISNGYTVTDEEVRSYLEELKEFINTADNKEDVYAVMEQFDSEQEYWEYEFTVYQKSLPIQKYVDNLEEQYERQTAAARGSAEFLNDFNTYFEDYKQGLVKAENYRIVK